MRSVPILVLAVWALLVLAPAAAADCPHPVGPADTSAPTAVVGAGTPGSCTHAALAAAVAAGGVVTFDCGPAPVTIAVPSALQVGANTVVDGGHLVTLDGGDTTRLFAVPSIFTFGTPTLTVQRIALTRGSSAGLGGDDTNRGGGAIWTRGGSLRLVEVTITDSHGPSSGQDVAGGAVYAVGVGSVSIVDSVLLGNSASNGGAIGVLHGDLAIADTAIEDNAATGTGGNPGHGGNGGGVYLDGVGQDVSLCGVRLIDNAANAFGGGLFRVSNDGVGPMAIDRSVVRDNHIPDHTPSMAGGLYLQGVQITLTRSTIARNRARSAGGLFIGPNGTTLAMENVTVAENVALSSLAGGIAISSGVTGSIRHATFARNAAPGALAFAGATTGGQGVSLRATIVDGHVAGNGWNPISCLHPFQEGGANLQWPVARAGGGSDVPGALCSASVTVADALLGPLLGGAMPVVTPGAGSPALGLASDCPLTDQLGRPRDAQACDAGAIEVPEPGALSLQVSAWLTLAAWSAAARSRPRRRRLCESSSSGGRSETDGCRGTPRAGFHAARKGSIRSSRTQP